MVSPAPLPAAPRLRERLAAGLQRVVGLVTRRIWQAPHHLHGVLIPVMIAGLINEWINRRQRLIGDLLLRIGAGTQRAPRPYKARESRPDVVPERRRPRQAMPSRFAWLCALAQEVRAEGLFLGSMLREPEMQEKVLAHPQLARLIRPLLRMLGEREPAWMPPRPKRMSRIRRKRPPDEERGGEADERYGLLERLIDHACEVTRRKAAPAAAVPPLAVPAQAVPPQAVPPAASAAQRSRPRVPPGWNAVPGHEGREPPPQPAAPPIIRRGPRVPPGWCAVPGSEGRDPAPDRGVSPLPGYTAEAERWRPADAASRRRGL